MSRTFLKSRLITHTQNRLCHLLKKKCVRFAFGFLHLSFSESNSWFDEVRFIILNSSFAFNLWIYAYLVVISIFISILTIQSHFVVSFRIKFSRENLNKFLFSFLVSGFFFVVAVIIIIIFLIFFIISYITSNKPKECIKWLIFEQDEQKMKRRHRKIGGKKL